MLALAHVYSPPQIAFNIQKVEQVYNNYTVNYHAGVTLVMGHPLGDKAFRERVTAEQEAIKAVFKRHGLEDVLILYDPDYQVHATLIELASQHDAAGTEQKLLKDEELTTSKTKTKINIDYSIQWIKKTTPFEVELGPGVLSIEHHDQTIRITDSGQLVMKGRAKDRKLLAEIRTEFEEKAGIVHKYGKEDDEFFFVIGYVKPDFRLNGEEFLTDLTTCINSRRPHIQLALKVDAVTIIAFDKYSLDKESCLWQRELKFQAESDLPEKTLLDTIKGVNKFFKPLFEGEDSLQEAI